MQNQTLMTLILAILLTFTWSVSIVALTRSGNFKIEITKLFKFQTDWRR